MKQKTPDIWHFYLFIALQDCAYDVTVTSYLSENEAANLQDGDAYLVQIPNFKTGYLENHLAH